MFKTVVIVITPILLAGIVLTMLLCSCYCRRKKRKKQRALVRSLLITDRIGNTISLNFWNARR